MRREPQRVQRRRTRGWKMPSNAIYVGRPTKWGNPFRLDPEDPTQVRDEYDNTWQVGVGNDWRKLAVDLYRIYTVPNLPSLFVLRRLLAGHDLCCWCPLPEPGQPDHCHAAVLLKLANGGEPHE